MKELHDLPWTDDRLRLAASFVRRGSVPCDVGTDHGYLPIYLILTGICPRAVVSDVNPMPLANAREMQPDTVVPPVCPFICRTD